ncbi:hypothetical protein LJC18_00135 [Lachnospiraceae bacterium OttesenSCG-928-E19]|nr:hypothetical protein [Lachnospiraceae bacterium OttesenSCG-928-E19]
MRLKTAGLLTLATLLGGATNANAAMLYDIYAGLTLGAGGQTIFAGDDNNSTSAAAYGAVIGMDIPLVRIELEYNYLNASESHMHVGMINAYFKMPSTVIKPYLGIGLGTVFNGDVDDTFNIRNEPAYQGMLGLTFDIPVIPFNVDVEGRVLYAPDVFKTADAKPDLLHYDLRLKLRYVF